MRERIRLLVTSPGWETIITGLIMLNAVTLGLETNKTVMGAIGGFLHHCDQVILAIFTVEIVLRLYAYGLRFFKDPWSVFDFIVVAITFLPISAPFAALRALRILRVLRLVSMMPSLRKVVSGLLSALPGMRSISLLTGLVFYVFAVMATMLFGDAFPEWFGSLSASFYTLFQIMTLESWSMGIVRPVMEVYPMAWMFFLPFIIATAFNLLNLCMGIIVSAMQEEHEKETADNRLAIRDEVSLILDEVRALRLQVSMLEEERNAAAKAVTLVQA